MHNAFIKKDWTKMCDQSIDQNILNQFSKFVQTSKQSYMHVLKDVGLDSNGVFFIAKQVLSSNDISLNLDKNNLGRLGLECFVNIISRLSGYFHLSFRYNHVDDSILDSLCAELSKASYPIVLNLKNNGNLIDREKYAQILQTISIPFDILLDQTISSVDIERAKDDNFIVDAINNPENFLNTLIGNIPFSNSLFPIIGINEDMLGVDIPYVIQKCIADFIGATEFSTINVKTIHSLKAAVDNKYHTIDYITLRKVTSANTYNIFDTFLGILTQIDQYISKKLLGLFALDKKAQMHLVAQNYGFKIYSENLAYYNDNSAFHTIAKYVQSNQEGIHGLLKVYKKKTQDAKIVIDDQVISKLYKANLWIKTATLVTNAIDISVDFFENDTKCNDTKPLKSILKEGIILAGIKYNALLIPITLVHPALQLYNEDYKGATVSIATITVTVLAYGKIKLAAPTLSFLASGVFAIYGVYVLYDAVSHLCNKLYNKIYNVDSSYQETTSIIDIDICNALDETLLLGQCPNHDIANADFTF